MDRLRVLFRRARQILQTEGLFAVLRRGLEFSRIFQYGTYLLYEGHPQEELKGKTEADFMPKIRGFTYKIVSSNQEADELESEGLEFRSQVTKAREKLDRGAVALCIFVEKDFAHIWWDAFTEEAKQLIDPLPYKVDFENGEICGGGAWTNPKYRRMGFSKYCTVKGIQFLKRRGIVTNRYSTSTSNIAAQGSAAKFNPETYAEARCLRILGWKSWREKPLT